jgi:hypothetical protein
MCISTYQCHIGSADVCSKNTQKHAHFVVVNVVDFVVVPMPFPPFLPSELPPLPLALPPALFSGSP